jgi:hypothetical protein
MVWPIIREMNNFRVASSYGRGRDQSTNGSSDRACQAQSACFAWRCGSQERTITPQWSATLPLGLWKGYAQSGQNPSMVEFSSDGLSPGYSEPRSESFSTQALVSVTYNRLTANGRRRRAGK